MVAYNKINAFVENLAEKVHNLGADALTYALTTNANSPTAGKTTLSTITPISYTGLTSTPTGRKPTITSSAQTSGVYKLIVSDLTITSTGTPAAFGTVVLYNDTPTSPADPLIGWWEYGSDVTLASTETFTINADQTNGILQIA